MAWRQVRSRGEQTRRFGEPQRGDRHQHQREDAADDKDDRPAEPLVQQQGDDLAADKTADRRPGEAQHDHHRAQALRRVVAGQRHRSGKPAGDASAGEEARSREEAERGGKGAGQRGETEERQADQQQRLAPAPVADRAGGESARHDADVRPQKGQREGRWRHMPGMGQGRHRPADRANIVAVAHLNEAADCHDPDLQAAEALVFQRLLGRRKRCFRHLRRPPVPTPPLFWAVRRSKLNVFY